MNEAFRPSAERLKLMQTGMVQLKQWLTDLLTIGVLQFDFEHSLQQITSRMVDAKLGGIANRLRRLGSLDRSDPNWGDRVVNEFARMYLLVVQFNKLDELTEVEKSVVYAQCGFNIRKEALLQKKGLHDHWVVMGQKQQEVDNLQIRKTWLTGLKTLRSALLLDYAFGRSRFAETWSVGSVYEGNLVFYPSTFSLRAILRGAAEKQIKDIVPASFTLIADFIRRYTVALSKNLWLESFPCSLSDVYIVQEDHNFFVMDREQKMLTVGDHLDISWSLLSIAGGHPITLFGEWTGRSLHILSFLENGRIYTL
ncbi:MAG: hypothetical protein OEQ53_02130 [Saprospiraceae bacterium]|nr:hypothetical protein [Saprospiraceae bacterium]